MFAELQLRKALADELPLKTVLREHRSAVILSMLLTWLLSAGVVITDLMTPSVLQTAYGFAPAQTLQANSLAIVFLSCGCIFAGMLADRFGAGRILILGSLLLLAVLTWTFYSNLKAHPDLAAAAVCADRLGRRHDRRGAVCTGQCLPAGGAFQRPVVLLQRLAYAIFGGLTPMAVAFLLKYSGMGPAYYVIALCGLGLLIGLYLFRQRR